jgi:hypothetical protein
MTSMLLAVKLCTAFSTIHHLQLDDYSWQSADRVYALELISKLNLSHLTSFRYESCAVPRSNREHKPNEKIYLGEPSEASRIFPGQLHRDIYELRRYRNYIGYLESNKGIMLINFS